MPDMENLIGSGLKNKFRMMRRMPFMLLLSLSGLFGTAQTKGEKEVAAATEALRKAMVDADSMKLDKLTADKLSYGHSNGHVDDKPAFLSKLVSGKSDFVTMTLSEQTVSVSGKTAVVRHKLDATTNDNGKPGEVHLLVMLVWQKLHGNWKLIARQAVKTQ
jgi:ketosteroid isomerase-like protein